MKTDPKTLKGATLGLAIVAMVAVIAAAIIGYVRKGEINLILLLPFAVILASSLLIYGNSTKSEGN